MNSYSQTLDQANLAFLRLTAEALLKQVPSATCDCSVGDADGATLMYVEGDAQSPLVATLRPRDEHSVALWIKEAGDASLSIHVLHLPFSPLDVAECILSVKKPSEQTYSEVVDQFQTLAHVKFLKEVARIVDATFDAPLSSRVSPLGVLQCRGSAPFGNPICVDFRFSQADLLRGRLFLFVEGDPSSYKGTTTTMLEPHKATPSTVAHAVTEFLRTIR